MMCCEGCLSSQRSFDREEDTCTQAEEGRTGGGSGQCLPNIVTQSLRSAHIGLCVGVMSYLLSTIISL